MTGVDVERMRRYIDRTNAAAEDAARDKRDREARSRGGHCGLCVDNPHMMALHLAVQRVVNSLPGSAGRQAGVS